MKKLILLLMGAAIAAELFSRRSEPEAPAMEREARPSAPPVFKTAEECGKAVLTDVRGAGRVLAVPGEVDGKELAGIGWGAFMELGILEEVILPDQVSYIGTGAFTECPRLRKVALGKGLQRISRCAFDCCPALTELALPEGAKYLKGPLMVGGGSLQALTVPGMGTLIEGFEGFQGLIVTPEGSAADTYAKEHGIRTQSL